MKILTDLQACQSLPHRARGIGRYALSLAAGMHDVRAHDLRFALNAAIPGTIETVRAALPAGASFLIWQGLRGTHFNNPENVGRRLAAGVIRQAALAAERADIHHIGSYFEGFSDDVIVDIPERRATPVAVTLYDLIPLLHQDTYLADPGLRRWYLDRVDSLKRADLLLAISECTRRDAIEWLGFPPDRVVNISAAADPMFRPEHRSSGDDAALRRRHGLNRRFLFYTGGIDHRKNIERLVQAFSRVDRQTRRGVQLAITCSVDGVAASGILAQAAAAGLAPGDVVLTGYVSNGDLVGLYNACEGFVFPSWYEGFGLPVLEAMACGAAVIASNNSSLPEVVGRADALFDALDVDSIARSITRLLIDTGFRRSLREHALVQSRKFSWAATAKRALCAMDETVRRVRIASTSRGHTPPKPTLAFVSPLPPARSGIADYSSELLPALAAHYRIVLVTDQQPLATHHDWSSFETRDLKWFDSHATEFDRIVFQLGNSAFHAHMPRLIERFGGVVVLHDFFLSGVVSHLQWASKVPGYWHDTLYRSHGYPALEALSAGADPEDMLLRYPCNLPTLEEADGVIVHSQHALAMAKAFYGANDIARDWSVVPFLKSLPRPADRKGARTELGFGADDFVVCSFGILGPGKMNDHLIEAWQRSSLAQDPHCHLVFVGGAHDPLHEAALREQIAAGAGHVVVTGYVQPDDYRRYLVAADAAVQLRQHSRGETSASVFDCLAYGIPTVVNAHGSMAELPEDAVMMLPDAFGAEALVSALETLRHDPLRRDALSRSASHYCHGRGPAEVAVCYREAIERCYSTSRLEGVRHAASSLSRIWGVLPEADRCEIAEAMAYNMARPSTPQVFVDVTELVRRDAKSGIQRVVRSVVLSLLKYPPDGYRVEPVHALPGQGYRYARAFSYALLNVNAVPLPDERITVAPGDAFIGLDLGLEEIPAHAAQLQEMRDLGASVHVVVYDLLPLVRNECFPPHAEPLFRAWLTSLATVADGAICISKAVADELQCALDGLDVERPRPLKIGYFHLGADIQESLPTRGVSEAERVMIASLQQYTSFLMVGTIEPRKGHAQALDAFEMLWAAGEVHRLVIVGKPGWMTDSLVERMRVHPQRGACLLWFDSASDEVLDILYGTCSALLVVSEGEGFGLPLIEAARHGLPILARDLPVFTEVAGKHARYFSGHSASDLAEAVRQWCLRTPNANPPDSSTMPWLTWKQSAKMLVDVAIGNAPYSMWSPGQRRYLPAYDTRHDVPPGSRIRDRVRFHGDAGFVMRTRPVDLPAGTYGLCVMGTTSRGGTLQVDIAGKTCTVAITAEATPHAHALTTLARCRFEIERDTRGIDIAIRADGSAAGEISGIVIEPFALNPEAGAHRSASRSDGSPSLFIQPGSTCG